ncbi:XRE family transcriptional regulator [Egibacter rhizosphaerae]|uniref:XRE family transcriptional regulator n=1 Tax=Egibacter rhizosphaerae TaxID=1670831 RepID=A0A411YJK3_9ACTN|nr:helix-turn-helix transcriptional regulator [Egibacter rhizosphaerae]QBI21296.1 XRE family transcriptional regulator [Egibacter rhizosphaerae]
MPLDATRIATRRHELGLSQRALARDLAVTSVVISALEAGSNHEHLTLHFAHRVADALALPLHALLTDNPAAPASEAHDRTEHAGDSLEADAAALGALPHHADDHRLPRDTAATSLGWTLNRTDRAADQLAQLLATTGATLQHHRGDLVLHPATHLTEPDALRDAIRAEHTRRQLPRTAAQLLHRALCDGELDTQRLTNNEHVALARLLHAGILGGEPPRPSRETMAALFPESAALPSSP